MLGVWEMASMSVSGVPQRPKPEESTVEPAAMSLTASSAEGTTLSTAWLLRDADTESSRTESGACRRLLLARGSADVEARENWRSIVEEVGLWREGGK